VVFIGEVALSALAELFGNGGNSAWKNPRPFSIDIERAKLSKNSVRAKAGYYAMNGGLISPPTRHSAGTVAPEERDSLRNLRGLRFGPSSLLRVLGAGREFGRAC
jgi:hypothetical protein